MASAISGTWQTSATRGRSSARPMRETFTQAFERVELALDGEDGAVESSLAACRVCTPSFARMFCM